MFANMLSRTIEWGDCDPAGIVFYPRYFAMFDAATATLIERASGMTRAEIIRRYDVISWPIVDTRAIFRATAAYDDAVRIESCVMRLGRASFDIEHRLLRDGILCIEAQETRVWASGSDGIVKALPIPEELRHTLSRAAETKD